METPKRNITTNVKSLSEYFVNDNSTDDNISELSDDKNNESTETFDSSDFLPPSRSPFIKQKYCVDHGEIQISTYTLKNEDDTINKENVRAEISKFMLYTLQFPCPLTFFGGIRKNIDSYVTYARCRYKSHRKSFRFSIIKLDEGVYTFFISGTKCEEIKHEGPTIFCTLRGKARKKV